MVECLIAVGIWCLIAWLLLFVAGKIIAMFIELPAKFEQIVMLIIGLVAIVKLAQCVGVRMP